MKNAKSSTWIRLMVAGSILCCLAGQGRPALGGEAPSLPKSVSVLCEIWRTADKELVGTLEALTEKSPENAAAVRTRLQEAQGKARRLSRFVSATASGKPLTHDDTHESAVQVPGRGGRPGGFGGFVKTGTRLELEATLDKAERVLLAFEIEVMGVGAAKAGSAMPGDRFTSKLEGSVTAPSGGMRMYQSNTKGVETLFVFLQATGL